MHYDKLLASTYSIETEDNRSKSKQQIEEEKLLAETMSIFYGCKKNTNIYAKLALYGANNTPFLYSDLIETSILNYYTRIGEALY